MNKYRNGYEAMIGDVVQRVADEHMGMSYGDIATVTKIGTCGVKLDKYMEIPTGSHSTYMLNLLHRADSTLIVSHFNFMP